MYSTHTHSDAPHMPPCNPLSWPYPRWIAHRGAGKLAPENTLAAFRQGLACGFRMFECDVKLSADGIPYLLHDATLERSTNAEFRWKAAGSAPDLSGGAHPWSALSQLDAGSWHSPAFTGEPLPTLEAIARFCIANHCQLNIEIKATPGMERQTGEQVARHAAMLWQGQNAKPLLSSFAPESLQGALASQPELPRALLIDTLQTQSWRQCLQQAQALQCQALVCNFRLWDADTTSQADAAGLYCLSYTVNQEEEARRLEALGVVGIITDRVDLLGPGAELRRASL